MNNRQNWAMNIQFQAENYVEPETIEQLQEIVRAATHVRIVGSGHSFNDIADTTGTLISLARLDKNVTFDHTHHTATVPAGMTYIELVPLLHNAGYALRNMASLPHITVIGACITATHGSGDSHGNLATQVSALEIVNDEGELVQLSRARHGKRFDGMVVSLGGLGVVTKVTLDLVPAFTMQQQVYRWLPMADMETHFDEIMGSGYSVSLFTGWQDKRINQVWVKHVLADGQAQPVPPNLFGATLATVDFAPLDTSPADSCTVQRGIPGPWYDRLPHFRLHSTVMDGSDERQSEYFVPRKDAVDALQAVDSLLSQNRPACFKVCEVRTVAADTLWLSTAYEQDCIGIHFSWYKGDDEIMRFLPVLEAALAPFHARPHWGKLFTTPPAEVRAMYPRLADFQALLTQFDPHGKFSNAYLARYIQ